MATERKATEVLTRLEIDAVVSFAISRWTAEDRRALMAFCPLAYMKLYGKDPHIVVATVKAVQEAI